VHADGEGYAGDDAADDGDLEGLFGHGAWRARLLKRKLGREVVCESRMVRKSAGRRQSVGRLGLK
jgi:hypothetical protein